MRCIKELGTVIAKRFGMPQEWVDDELKGAEALAYRLDLDVYGTKWCSGCYSCLS
jgi:hypothetical protein